MSDAKVAIAGKISELKGRIPSDPTEEMRARAEQLKRDTEALLRRVQDVEMLQRRDALAEQITSAKGAWLVGVLATLGALLIVSWVAMARRKSF